MVHRTQTYDGPLYSWLTKDGQRKKLSDKQLAELPPLEREVYEHWNVGWDHSPWTNDAGQFTPLPKDKLDNLDPIKRAQHEVARAKAALGLLYQ